LGNIQLLKIEILPDSQYWEISNYSILPDIEGRVHDYFHAITWLFGSLRVFYLDCYHSRLYRDCFSIRPV